MWKRRESIERWLHLGLNEWQQKLHAQLVRWLKREFRGWQRNRSRSERAQQRTFLRRYGHSAAGKVPSSGDRRSPDRTLLRQLVDFLGVAIARHLDELHDCRRDEMQFRRYHAAAPSPHERERWVLEFAARGSHLRNGRADRAAVRRWFGHDAIIDRFQQQRGRLEQRLSFCLDRLGTLVATTLTEIDDPENRRLFLGRSEIERHFHAVLQYQGDVRVQAAALRGMHAALSALTDDERIDCVSERTLTAIQRFALDRQQDVWSQCTALSILERLVPATFDEVLLSRFQEHGGADDIFTRRHVVRLAFRRVAEHSDLMDAIPQIADDPSPFVRQQLAECIYGGNLPNTAVQYWMRHLALDDPEPKVRAAALLSGLTTVDQPDLRVPFLTMLTDVSEGERDSLVLRALTHVAQQWIQQWHGSPERTDEPDVDSAARRVLATIGQLSVRAECLRVRRWAAQSAERIAMNLDCVQRGLLEKLTQHLRGLRPGGRRRIPRAWWRQYGSERIGRALAVLSQFDYGYSLRTEWSGIWITRGPQFRLRLWRVFHEWLHPSPDKRQAFSHTIARADDGTLRAPSGILGELSETRVPGEPLVIAQEGDWRPYLPLLDDFLSALETSIWRPIPARFFTSQGITTIESPRSPWRRWRAHRIISYRFAELARHRNWTPAQQASPAHFIQSMQQLGFRVTFQPHKSEYGDPVECTTDNRASHAASDTSVTQFFSASVLMASVESWGRLTSLGESFAQYFSSLFENSVSELVLFCGALLLVFVGAHLAANGRIRRARRQISLCLGGWGTRGKSGTERLKAALINALGHSLFSKSTGCEAMFMYGGPFGDLHELMLYRPYDKATIWEHGRVIQMAAQLESEVFLWECMGLTPAYVDVLQHQWTRDDLSTITNTYPDHEDLQGPAGWNIAHAIAGFIPGKAKLLTTEQQMLPILKQQCDDNRTQLRPIEWWESALLTDDVQQRFPYTEHPDNIALVAALAEELGCHRDFALKEMADRLVPDLGVLKTFPPAPLRTRQLEFTNGMSANERFGCLGNWQRMAFDRPDPRPGLWISTVVNNRADRVPRSRVFAQIVVRDLSADRHILIGTNLKGLQGYIWEAWDELAAEWTLKPADEVSADVPSADKVTSIAHGLQLLEQVAGRLRQPTRPEQVRTWIERMIVGVTRGPAEPPAESIPESLWRDTAQTHAFLKEQEIADSLIQSVLAFQGQWLKDLADYQALYQKIEAGQTGGDELDREFRQLLREWFARKLVIVHDENATGEQVVETLCEATPPGFYNRIMGLQNIKGTGLDFAYRWLTWERCYVACQNLLDENRPSVAQKGLATLLSIPDLGWLCAEHLRETVSKVQRSATAQRERIQADLEQLLSRLEDRLQQIEQPARAAASKGNWLTAADRFCEDVLDLRDGLHRRRLADQIYHDLGSAHIGWQQAAAELRELHKRQKDHRASRKQNSTKKLAASPHRPAKPTPNADVPTPAANASAELLTPVSSRR